MGLTDRFKSVFNTVADWGRGKAAKLMLYTTMLVAPMAGMAQTFVGNGTVDCNTTIGIQADQKGTTALNSLSVQDNGDIFYGEAGACGLVGQRDATTGEQEAVFDGYDVADVASEGNTTYFLTTDGNIYEIVSGAPQLLGVTSAGSTELKMGQGVAYTLDVNGNVNNFSIPVLTGLNLNGFEVITFGPTTDILGISDTGLYGFGIGDNSPSLITDEVTGHKVVADPASGHIIYNETTGDLLKYNFVTEQVLLLGTCYNAQDMEAGIGVTYIADGQTVSMTSNAGGSILAVTLSRFDLEEKDGALNALWTHETEINHDFTDVEVSCDGVNFTDDGTEWSSNPNGSSSTQTHYEYEVQQTCPDYTYVRLEANDLDGSVQYSETKVAQVNKQKQEPNVYPNPVTDRGTIHIDGYDGGTGFTLTNIFGQSVNVTANDSGSGYTIELPSGTPSGMYALGSQSDPSFKTKPILLIN